MSNLFEERYEKLNKRQKEAVDTIEGPLLVVAGPGSGKTEILSMRVAKILSETHALASNVLCLTFTESAALNMRERLAKLIGGEAYRVAIHTFHNFCTSVIERHPEFFWKGARFSPADELAQVRVLEEILGDLPHDNPLRVMHPEQGFIYVWPIIQAIGNIKKAGLTPDEFEAILAHNQVSIDYINKALATIFNERVSKGTISLAKGAVAELLAKAEEEKESRPFPNTYFPPIVTAVARSLAEAVGHAEEVDSAKPLSEWKEDWLKKDDAGERVFKDARAIEKLRALAGVYRAYREAMFRKGYYDFDDMILDCIRAFEDIPALRYDLQEQFQYILVDEFQDTNDAQMRLLRALSDAEVNEGRPNLMAVGDDDQAVYKFQGAELSNIIEFARMWNDVKVVTLTDNYRSTEHIIKAAQHIIRKGTHRLERLLPNIEKTLVASNKALADGRIVHRELPTVAHEYHFVAREIARLIREGTKPEDIAVITRRHRELGELVPYLRSAGVSIRYEREQNVLHEPHVKELITIARFVASLADKHADEADELLPGILSYKFWGLSRETVWKIALEARRAPFGTTWLEVMRKSDMVRVRDIADFLIGLGADAPSEPLEFMLDRMVGAHVALGSEPDEDEGDDDPLASSEQATRHTKEDRSSFTSPFKSFYFSKERFEYARAEYLSFLSSLRVFVRALREYRQGEPLFIRDLVTFVDIHEKNDIPLNDQSPFARLPNAVQLLTAHKAKGLEFDTVFVLSCQDDVWAGRGRGSMLAMPINLPIEPAGDSFDDQLRLFYVALTRAKRHLYLTSYTTGEDGEQATKLRFLVREDGMADAPQVLYEPETGDADLPDTHEVLTSTGVSFYAPPFRGSERELLQSLVDGYELSVTHLNNFLAVDKGGPQYFLENNLLRFPQAKVPSGAYGSAIHKTLEEISIVVKKDGRTPDMKKVIDSFEKNLRHERLHPDDFELYLGRGQGALRAFYAEKKDSFRADDLVEFNFKGQGVVLGEAKLTGKIDRIVKESPGELSVHDYKTGSAFSEWKGKSDYEKTKLYGYERQLLFYRLLVEHSREFAGKAKARKGVLEFVEPARGKVCDLILELSDEKIERLARLIGVVYKKIQNVDFPDVSKYDKNLKGIQAFEEDLLEGRV